MFATFVGVDDAAVIALAQLRLSRAGLKIPCTTRQQAVNILRSVRPAIAKSTPLARVLRPCVMTHEACRTCNKPVPYGTPCKVCFTGFIPEHINCRKPSKKQEDAALAKLYKKAIEQITIR